MSSTIECTTGADGLTTCTYIRSSHRASDEVSGAIAALYGPDSPSVLITPTGNAAVSLVVSALARHWTGDVHFVFGASMYRDTHRCLYRAAQIYEEIHLHKVDFHTPKKVGLVIEKLQGARVVLFVESCSSLTGRLVSPKLCAAVAAAAKSYHVIVDNTMLTSSRYNPFTMLGVNHGKLTVLASTSKHYSGGTAFGGFIASHHAPIVDRLHRLHADRGYHTHPRACKSLISNLDTVESRTEKSTANARQLISRLQEVLPKGAAIEHACQYTKAHSSPGGSVKGIPFADVFAVRVDLKPGHAVTPTTVYALAAPLENFRFATSFGGSESRIDTFTQIEGEWCRVRISVGYGGLDIEPALVDLVGLIRTLQK
jgi:cystathionine beta-lyase/cystathionine gamma-synthase